MAINRITLASESIASNTDMRIRMLSSRPSGSTPLATQVTPNTLAGYYDSSTDSVELYLSDPTGYKYVRVQ